MFKALSLLIILFFSLLQSLQADVSLLSFYTPSQNRQLVNQNVSAITQDSVGFIWVGTEKGVMRYDGSRYVTPVALKFLEAYQISALAVDQQSLLIATSNQGFYRYDFSSKKVEQYLEQNVSSDSQIINDRVLDIFVDDDNHIWLGTFTGITRLTPSGSIHIQNNPVDPTSIPAGPVTKLLKGIDDSLVMLIDGQMVEYDPITEIAEVKFYPELPAELEIYSLSPYKALGYWLATNQGAWLIDKQGVLIKHLSESTEPSLASNIIQNIYTDNQGNCWFIFPQGIDWLDAQQKLHHETQDVSDNLSLRSAVITSIFQDRDYNIWLGQLNNGPAITNTQLPFARIKHSPLEDNSLSHNYVFDLAIDQSKQIVIATANGVNRFGISDKNISKLIFRKDGIPLLYLQPIQVEVDRQNQIWMIDHDGELYISNESGDLLTEKDYSDISMLKSLEVERLSKVDKNHIWIATLRELILVDTEQVSVIARLNLDAITAWPIMDIAVSDDLLWLGTLGGGFRGVSYATDKIPSVVYDSQIFAELEGLVINQIKLFGNSVLVASNRGLAILNRTTKQVQIIDESSGLPDQNILAVESDEDAIWVSGLKSISKIHLFPSIKIQNFDPTVGIPNIEISNIARDETDSWIYFSTSSGIYMFDKEGGTETPPLRKPNITKLRIDNYASLPDGYMIPELLKLSHNQNDFRIEFAHMDYRPVKRYAYQTRLKGYREQWQNQEEAFALYTNLDKGRYQFEVRTVDSVSGNISPIRSVQFQITPPIWLSLPAYIMYLLLIVGALYGFYANYTRKLAEQKAIADHLRNLDQLKDEFLANTSHELKTPLNGIIGLSESLLNGVAGSLSPKIEEHLRLISKSGERLSSLVEEILDHKQLEKGTLALNLKPCDARTTSDIVLDMCRPLSDKKDITLINNISKNHVFVVADENRLQQILFNLVSNAIKYSEHGDIIVDCRLSESAVTLYVTDQGKGIESNKVASIFNPFERLETSKQGAQGGTGLGLSVTKALVELHQGTIEVSSILNKGSTFSFTLPRTFDLPIQTNLQPMTTRNTVISTDEFATLGDFEHREGQGDLIIVVDDEPVNLKVAADSLKLKGYQVIETTSGYSALDLIKEHPVALVVLDVMMPEISGFEVCRRIRKIHTEIELPILLLSARNSAKDVATGMAAGANDYISKPINQLELITRVSNLLDIRKLIDLDRQKELTAATEKTYNRLRQYFPKAVVDYIVKDRDTKILAEKRIVTILFSDLVNFTELSSQLDPTIITALLSEFVEEMAQVVEKHAGVMNEILGDGLVILFGAPTRMDKEQQAAAAVACSIEMHQKLDELNTRWLSSNINQRIDMRIGIHQDSVTAGSIGSKAYRAYRAVGVGVNLASRIQHEAAPGTTLVSSTVFDACGNAQQFSSKIEAQVKGIAGTIELHQIRAHTSENI
jgi:two-component system, sensor histidine kinase ChiS